VSVVSPNFNGEYLIDDRLANGARDFGGLHVHFGPENEKEARIGKYADKEIVKGYFS
jgi:hypothetical protein